MKLIISEYLRTLKERDELDRLIKDLIVEMGYEPIAKPERGNREFGVDIAARGKNMDGIEELMLFVIKQGDIGRREWDGGPNAIMQSVNDVFLVYFRSHIEPSDLNKPKRIIVATSGDLKRTVQPSWTGFVDQHKSNATIEFWGTDKLAALIDTYLLNEHLFDDDDQLDLRRALALSGDTDYDGQDFHKILLRQLDLDDFGKLKASPKTGRKLRKSLKIIQLATKMYATWTLREGADSRQGLKAIERSMLWTWHRLSQCEESELKTFFKDFYSNIWASYFEFQISFFNRLHPYYYTKNSIYRSFASTSAEASLIAFEQIGILSSFIVTFMLTSPLNEEERTWLQKHIEIFSGALTHWIKNNGITSSPCLDRHSQDITLAMIALTSSGKTDEAREWLRKLTRNVDYSFKAKKYVPISNDSIEDLIFEGGWEQETTSERLMEMSWMLPTLAGWSVILKEVEAYEALSDGCDEGYTNTTLQLWHPENDMFKTLYFENTQFNCGVAEAPINLHKSISDYQKQMQKVVDSKLGKVFENSLAAKHGLASLDFIAFRHFGTPIAPVIWYRFLKTVQP